MLDSKTSTKSEKVLHANELGRQHTTLSYGDGSSAWPTLQGWGCLQQRNVT